MSSGFGKFSGNTTDDRDTATYVNYSKRRITHLTGTRGDTYHLFIPSGYLHSSPTRWMEFRHDDPGAQLYFMALCLFVHVADKLSMCQSTRREGAVDFYVERFTNDSGHTVGWGVHLATFCCERSAAEESIWLAALEQASPKDMRFASLQCHSFDDVLDIIHTRYKIHQTGSMLDVKTTASMKAAKGTKYAFRALSPATYTKLAALISMNKAYFKFSKDICTPRFLFGLTSDENHPLRPRSVFSLMLAMSSAKRAGVRAEQTDIAARREMIGGTTFELTYPVDNTYNSDDDLGSGADEEDEDAAVEKFGFWKVPPFAINSSFVETMFPDKRAPPSNSIKLMFSRLRSGVEGLNPDAIEDDADTLDEFALDELRKQREMLGVGHDRTNAEVRKDEMELFEMIQSSGGEGFVQSIDELAEVAKKELSVIERDELFSTNRLKKQVELMKTFGNIFSTSGKISPSHKYCIKWASDFLSDADRCPSGNFFREHAKTFPNLSRFGNLMVRWATAAETLLMASQGHVNIIRQLACSMSVFNSRPLKPNLLYVGPGQTGKSFILSICGKILIPGTSTMLSDITAAGLSSGTDDMDFMSIFMGEAPPALMAIDNSKFGNSDGTDNDTSDKGTAFKDILTDGSYVKLMKVKDEVTGNWEQKKIESKVNVQVSVATNASVLKMAPAMLTRFHVQNVNQNSTSRPERSVADCMFSEQTDAMKRMKSSFIDEVREMQYFTCLVYATIRAGIVKMDTSAGMAMIRRIDACVRKMGLSETVTRDMERVFTLAETLTIWNAVDCFFHSGNETVLDDDMEWSASTVIALEPYLVVTEEIVIFAVSLFKDQYEDPLHYDIINAIISIMKEPNRAMNTVNNISTAILDEDKCNMLANAIVVARRKEGVQGHERCSLETNPGLFGEIYRPRRLPTLYAMRQVLVSLICAKINPQPMAAHVDKCLAMLVSRSIDEYGPTGSVTGQHKALSFFNGDIRLDSDVMESNSRDMISKALALALSYSSQVDGMTYVTGMHLSTYKPHVLRVIRTRVDEKEVFKSRSATAINPMDSRIMSAYYDRSFGKTSSAVEERDRHRKGVFSSISKNAPNILFDNHPDHHSFEKHVKHSTGWLDLVTTHMRLTKKLLECDVSRADYFAPVCIDVGAHAGEIMSPTMHNAYPMACSIRRGWGTNTQLVSRVNEDDEEACVDEFVFGDDEEGAHNVDKGDLDRVVIECASRNVDIAGVDEDDDIDDIVEHLRAVEEEKKRHAEELEPVEIIRQDTIASNGTGSGNDASNPNTLFDMRSVVKNFEPQKEEEEEEEEVPILMRRKKKKKKRPSPSSVSGSESSRSRKRQYMRDVVIDNDVDESLFTF